MSAPMTDEQLLFGAAMTVAEMNATLRKTWDENRFPAMAEMNVLEEQSRRVNSAIIALRQRAAGVKPPKIGDYHA